MTTFDAAVPQLLAVCASTPGFDAADTRTCVLRDLKGRLRVAIDLGKSPLAFDVPALTLALENALGGYFVGPLLCSNGPPEVRRLVTSIFETAEPWPDAWPTAALVGSGSQPIDRSRWRAVRKVLSKQAWLEPKVRAKAPWPLVPSAKTGPPVIVSFYSYKGGVGRTTLLGLVARALAKQRKRVVVVDLDLEAPGAAIFLGGSTPSGRGVIDFIVDHVVTGKARIDGLYGRAAAMKDGLDTNVDVFPAGSVNATYLEKLGRLDFVSASADGTKPSPSEAALRTLLKVINAELKPDYILLDARAGLHDLGGLSLHALSHIDVLVARGGPQSIEGLRITALSLARLRDPDDRRIVLVHSLVPSDRAVADKERSAFQDEAYEIFETTIYADAARAVQDGNESEDADADPATDVVDDEDPELPSYEDDQAAHFAWPVKRYTEFETARTIGDIDDAFADTEEIRAIVDRIAALAAAEEA
jgi:cellulose biosynthesis protein BcsQ